MKTYHYNRDTGSPLPGQPKDAAFLAAVTEAEKIHPKDVGNVNTLIRDYLLSLTFARKRASSHLATDIVLSALAEHLTDGDSRRESF